MFTLEVSWETELYESGELYMRDGLEMSGYIVVTLGAHTA